MIYHDLQYFCTKHLCFPALLYHFWRVSRGVKVHRTTAALGLGVQRWWTKAAAQSNSRWSRWNLWLSHVGYTVMLDWICFKEHVYVFNWYLGIHVRACVCVCVRRMICSTCLYTHYYSLLYDINARCLWNDTFLVRDLNSITRPRVILVQENVMTWPTRKGLRIKSQGLIMLFSLFFGFMHLAKNQCWCQSRKQWKIPGTGCVTVLAMRGRTPVQQSKLVPWAWWVH